MSVLTTLMGLGKAVDGDNAKTYLETVLGGAIDAIDGHTHENGKGAPVKRIQSGTAAARPAFGNAGHVYFATDTGAFSGDNGTAWVDQAGATNAVTLTNKTIDSANNTLTIRSAALAADVARGNQLTNGGHELAQRGSGPFTANAAYALDRWQINLLGTDTLSVAPDTTTANRKANSKQASTLTFTLGTGGGLSSYRQTLKISDGYHHLLGQPFTLRAPAKGAVASAIRGYVKTDGTGGTTTTSPFHSGGGAYENLDVPTITVPTDATFVEVGYQLAVSGAYSVDNTCGVNDTVACDYKALTPAEDGARCRRYYQRWTGTGMIAAGQGSGGASTFAVLPLTSAFGGAPTLTVSAAADWNLLTANGGTQAVTALALGGATAQAVALTITSAAIVAGNATMVLGANANSWLALEFNP